MSGAGAAEVRETHTAVLWFLGERVHKLKKPVDLGFCDFTTVARRREACEREVALNSRLSPEAYLGVETLLDPQGAVTDHFVLMRRLPAGTNLGERVRAGHDVRHELRAVARRLAAFHTMARRAPEITAEGSTEAARRRWASVLDGLHRHAGTLVDGRVVDEIGTLAGEFLAGRDRLFTDRAAAGRIVDGHGDLLADDVFCPPGGPVLLDCLEFDDRLRFVDVLDDAAFLAMDLEHHGGHVLGEEFLADYAEFSGERWPPTLARHFVSYRAAVRAAVSCVRADQGGAVASTAVDLLALSRRAAEQARVRLVLIGGLPGTGKTTVAEGLAERLGAVVVSSDPIRKELAGLRSTDSAKANYRAGLYTEERTAETYAEMLVRAATLLGRGESVVLDASWSDAVRREDAAALARGTHATLSAIECRAPLELTEARIRSRHGSASDATPLVAAVMSLDADPWPEATALDTTDTPVAVVEAALDAVRHPRPHGAWTAVTH